MPPYTRHRSSPLLAVAIAGLIAAVVGISIAAAAASPAPGGAVAGVTGRPFVAAASPTPTRRPSQSPSATPTATATAAPPSAPPASASPTPKPVLAMNLYRKGDFVSQATKDQCVSAAMQIMLNIIGPKNDQTKATQARLATIAEQLSNAPNGGTEPRGWASGLERLGAGAYKVEIAPSRAKAIVRAVRAIRATGRPVGLLVWRGAHSWVLHGFEASADPAAGTPLQIRYLYVTDPWYPRISSIWGPSRGPNAKITPKQLEEDYLQWRRPTGRYPGMDGEYVLVLPVDG
jgi:hypothetical protein